MKLSNIVNTLNYIIDNNANLVKAGKKPVAVCIEGEAGIGKTAVVEQLAKDKNMSFTKIVLSQLEEVGD